MSQTGRARGAKFTRALILITAYGPRRSALNLCPSLPVSASAHILSRDCRSATAFITATLTALVIFLAERAGKPVEWLARRLSVPLRCRLLCEDVLVLFLWGKKVLRKAHSPHGVYLFSCNTELFLLYAQGAHLGIGRRTLQHDSTSDVGTRLGARHIPFQFESPAGFPPR